jgi:hypothetical protein
MKRPLVGGLLSVLLISCAADEGPESLEDSDRYDEANPAFGRGVAEYRATLRVSSTPTNTILTALTDWSCATTGSLRYSEVQRDHNGNPTKVSHEQATGFGWFNVGDVAMPFTRNLDNDHPTVEVTVEHLCSRTVQESCPTSEDPNKTCLKSESFSIYWDCEPGLPSEPGQATTQQCESRSTFWGFLRGFSWAPFFQDLQVDSTVTLISTRTQFDYNNCTADNGAPFYLRLSQGVGGHFGEDDFVLNVDIDGQSIMRTPSTSGLYSLSLAYCPPEDQEAITVELSAVEEDLIWDDEYRAATVTMEPGQIHQAKLHREHVFGAKSSTVLIELFDGSE